MHNSGEPTLAHPGRRPRELLRGVNRSRPGAEEKQEARTTEENQRRSGEPVGHHRDGSKNLLLGGTASPPQEARRTAAQQRSARAAQEPRHRSHSEAQRAEQIGAQGSGARRSNANEEAEPKKTTRGPKKPGLLFVGRWAETRLRPGTERPQTNAGEGGKQRREWARRAQKRPQTARAASAEQCRRRRASSHTDEGATPHRRGPAGSAKCSAAAGRRERREGRPTRSTGKGVGRAAQEQPGVPAAQRGPREQRKEGPTQRPSGAQR